MPSTYDSLLRLELQATGENENTWGDKTNTNLELIGEAIAGHVSVDIAGSGNKTLTASNAISDQARKAFITLSGLQTGNVSVIAPTAAKLYVIRNNATPAGNIVLIKTASGAAVTVESSSLALYACDGLDFWRVEDTTKLALSGGTISGNLGITGNVSVAGVVSVSSLAVTDNAVFASVSAATLDVSGVAAIAGNVSIGGTLLVTGNLETDGALNVAGAVSAASYYTPAGTHAVGGFSINGTNYLKPYYDAVLGIGVVRLFVDATNLGFLPVGTNVLRLQSLSDGSGTYLEYFDGGTLYGCRSFLSDLKFKTNLNINTDDHLQLVEALKIKSFDWKNNGLHVPAGLIAQEVEEVIPSAVWATGDGTKHLDLQALTVRLIGAVKQLSERIRELEERIDDLEP